jgi:farnesyl-diphosphate farnesyltransferase
VNDAAEFSGSVETWSGKDRDAENFPVGVLIRPDVRRHVHAFYAFARNADDIADSSVLDPADKILRLGVMEGVLLGAREGGSPSAAGLRKSLAETGVGTVHAEELLRAFRQDAEKRRYANWDELMAYCRYSAMPVGRHVLALHGEDEASWEPSDSLCAVLQVLNHLQDASKDLLALDRCYVPGDMLAEEGAAVDDLRLPAETPALRRVFDRMLERCDAMNAAGAGLPDKVRDRRLRLETAIIVTLSHRLARRLRQGDPLATRVKLRPVDVAASVFWSARHLARRAA